MKYILLFFILTSSLVKAQTIKGKITDSENVAISNVNVLIKKAKNPKLIYQFTSTDENGQYSIALPVYLDSLIVEVTAVGYTSEQKTSFNLKKEDYPVQLDFILQKNATSLKEVVIKAKEKPVRVKNDTTTYNPNSFRDGTEKVVEDLLKKLPGVKVESNGEITFKGKTIKKMLLDGDDLFDSQYVVGSKNIDVEMIENVQAIEHYNENGLLNGIADSDDVALNLKLKKGKTDFSGNAKIGYGIVDQYDSFVNGLLINKKTKNFGLISHNNIGTNNTPYNLQSEINSVENSNDEALLSKTIINEGNLSSQLSDEQANLNDNFYFNFNTLNTLSKKFTNRINVGYYNDKLTRDNSTFSEYSLPNNSFTVNQSETLEKKLQIFSGNVQLLNKKSNKSSWEYLGKIRYQDIDFSSRSENNNLLQSNDVKSDYFFTKHNFNFTRLINKNTAFVASALYSKSSSPQKYSNSPGIAIDDNATLPILENNQTSTFKKEVINVKLDLLSSFNKFKLLLQTGFNSVKNNYDSFLTSLDSNNELFSNNSFRNDLNYSIVYPFAKSSILYKKGNNAVRLGLGLKYYKQQIEDNIYSTSSKNEKLVVSRSLKFFHSFTTKSIVVAGYDYSEAAPKESNIYNGIVQTNYRSFQNNETNLDFSKTNNYSLMFNYNDLFNLKRFQTIVSYSHTNNNYLNKTQINPNISTTTSFLAQTPTKDYSIIVFGEKYFHFIRTTLQLNSNYTISSYNDIVNNSDLRAIESKNLNIEISLRTGFKSLINLKSETIYLNNIFTVKDSNTNYINALNQNLKVIYNSKKDISATTSLNFISNDLSANNYYLFVESEVTFTSKNKKIDYALVAKNLTNNKAFETVSISDYYKTVASQNLIHRYIMVTCRFKF
jgi:hypothetical protein